MNQSREGGNVKGIRLQGSHGVSTSSRSISNFIAADTNMGRNPLKVYQITLGAQLVKEMV